MESDRLSRFVPKAHTVVLWLACATNAHCVQLQDQGRLVKTWGAPEQIDDAGSDPDVAIDASGDAVVVWVSISNNGIFSSRYTTDGRAWTSVEEISLPASDVLDRSAVAMDASGRAVAVWAAFFRADNVWANLSGVDGSWNDVPARLDSNDSATRSPMDSGPHVSANAGGAAVALWVQVDAPEEHVWAARLAPDGSWRRAVPIDHNNATRSFGPQVAVDANGNATAVWAMEDGLTSQIWSNRYNSGAGWAQSSERVDGDGASDAKTPRVGMDARGHAIAVWSQLDGGISRIWSNHYIPDTGWGTTAVRLDLDEEGDATAPDLAVLPDGSAVAVWSQSSGGTTDIWATRYNGARWGRAAAIESNVSASATATAPRVAVDSKGGAVAVWRQSEGGQSRIWASRSNTNGAWEKAVPIDVGEGSVGNPRVAVDPRGTAVAVWVVASGTSRGIWANRLE